jgi:SAM-dependent methyltransferase
MEYNQTIALHYAAYRPALHSLILKHCLKRRTFDLGVDIGCGTGQSAIALSNFCKAVIGFEPSPAMLQNAVFHTKVSYRNSFEEITEPYDLLCYFGSLEYVSQSELEPQLSRLQADGTLICCDFEVDFEPFFQFFGAYPEASDYHHEKNLSNYRGYRNFNLDEQQQVPLAFSCTLSDGLHLLLSSNSLYATFKSLSGSEDPEAFLRNALERHFPSGTIEMRARGFYTRYQKVGD